MKKVIASTLGLVLASGVAATTASALENKFGGYWRTRIFYQDKMTANPTGDYQRADNRTRLYYTAIFNENFKFVNKFEFNSIWGDDNGGDIGADGDTWRVKNSYADFTLGSINTRLGIMGATVARGFIFADDFSGALVTGKFGTVNPTFMYAQVESEDGGGNAFDEALFGLLVPVKVGAIKVTPTFVFHSGNGSVADGGDIENFYLGADVDVKMDALSVWGSAFYNGGEINGVDNAGYLLAVGVDAGIVHGQFFYASGDDDATDTDNDAFVPAPGSSYYWSEIMGLGMFDNATSPGSPNDNITNIIAVNAGVTLKPMDKLTLSADLWYAMLAEEDAAGEDELGVEINGKVAYKLFDNLTAEAIIAFLSAGDATAYNDQRGEDATEAGVRISLKF